MDNKIAPKVTKKKIKRQIWIDKKLISKAQTYAKEKGLKTEYVYEDVFKRGLADLHLINEEGKPFG